MLTATTATTATMGPARTLCHTCDHVRFGHSVSGCVVYACRCRLFIDPNSTRAKLRVAAADMGWRLRAQELLDDFSRAREFVTVIYTAHDNVMGVNTSIAYVPGARAGRAAALDALLAPA